MKNSRLFPGSYFPLSFFILSLQFGSHSWLSYFCFRSPPTIFPPLSQFLLLLLLFLSAIWPTLRVSSLLLWTLASSFSSSFSWAMDSDFPISHYVLKLSLSSISILPWGFSPSFSLAPFMLSSFLSLYLYLSVLSVFLSFAYISLSLYLHRQSFFSSSHVLPTTGIIIIHIFSNKRHFLSKLTSGFFPPPSLRVTLRQDGKRTGQWVEWVEDKPRREKKWE